MQDGRTYDTFLSYNSLDHAIVERVAEELRTRECKCFIDRRYLQPGRDWVDALERALSSSGSVAMFIGPHEMGRWQQRERAWALDRLAGATDFPVIPVLLPGCEPPLGFMKQLMWIDLRNDPADPVQLDALAAAIRGEEVDQAGQLQPRAMICPYRGLFAFREEDADFFFGRQKYTDDLEALVRQNPIVAVTGASGSGKSSVVRAGLVPRLRRLGDGGVWDILTMFPRENPLHSLADVFLPLVEPELSGIDLIRKRKTLAEDLEHSRVPLWDLVTEGLRQQKGTDRLLLVVDQWEELYTNRKNDNQRNRFIEELLEATSRNDSPLSVVLTVRWDFYGEILNNRPLLDRLQHSRLDLGPMNRDELRSVIEEPGNKVGLTFQDGLVDRILDAAGDEPGRLPLLEFVLDELWKSRRGDGQLTHDAYRDLGSLTGAIANRAETLFTQLSSEEQTAAEPLFRRLVQAGAKTEEDTRRRADLHSLDETAQRVARKLADERLLVTTRTEAVTNAAASDSENGTTGETVEVAHEELLRRWDRLKEWVDDDRRFLQWTSRLDLKVEEFQRDGDVALFRGKPLLEAQEYYPERHDDLDDQQITFLVKSLIAEHYREKAEHERLKSAQQSKTRIRRGVSVAVVAAICIAVAVYVSQQRATARIQMEKYLAANADTAADGFEVSVAPYERYVTEPLHKVFDEGKRTDSQRLNAAYALARFDAVKPEELKVLLQAIPTAKSEHRKKNFDLALRSVSDRELLENLIFDLAKEPVTDGSFRYGLTGLSLGITSSATICTQFDADATDRTGFIHRWKEWPADIDTVIRLLGDTTTDDGLRSALCVLVGRHAEDEAWVARADQLIPHLKAAYKAAEEPGPHFMAEWALRQWDVAPKSTESQTGKWKPNSQKMMMVRIPAGSFRMGSEKDDPDASEDEWPARDVPVSEFWLSNREVSVEQFMTFFDHKDYKGPSLVDWNKYDKDTSPEFLCPVQRVSWLDAVRYCNWLSRKEDFEIAYDEEEWKPIPNAKGYRLPTEREWEYACRAGTDTSFYFGSTDRFLSMHAVHSEATTLPGGSRIPNAWGLFDMSGNVDEWCEDTWRASYAEDAETDANSRVLRGGSFHLSIPQYLRSAYRLHYTPDLRNYYVLGFRISRTP